MENRKKYSKCNLLDFKMPTKQDNLNPHICHTIQFDTDECKYE